MAEKTKDEVLQHISKLNEKLVKQYETLGEKYYKTHSKDYAKEVEAEIKEIDDIVETIEKENGYILELDGMCRCEECKSIISIKSKFCPECGHKRIQEEEQPQETKVEQPTFCLNCGNKLEPEDKFCMKCGQKVNSMKPEKVDVAEEKSEDIPIRLNTKASQKGAEKAVTVSPPPVPATPTVSKTPISNADTIVRQGDKIKCVNCGRFSKDTLNFCVYCGSKLEK